MHGWTPTPLPSLSRDTSVTGVFAHLSVLAILSETFLRRAVEDAVASVEYGSCVFVHFGFLATGMAGKLRRSDPKTTEGFALPIPETEDPSRTNARQHPVDLAEFDCFAQETRRNEIVSVPRCRCRRREYVVHGHLFDGRVPQPSSDGFGRIQRSQTAAFLASLEMSPFLCLFQINIKRISYARVANRRSIFSSFKTEHPSASVASIHRRGNYDARQEMVSGYRRMYGLECRITKRSWFSYRVNRMHKR